jgi:hypothetical protein
MPYVIFTLKNYLTKLHQEDAVLPSGRHIPSQKELADKCQMNEVSFSRMVNNDRDAIPYKVLAALITEFRERGFPIEFDDLLKYVS